MGPMRDGNIAPVHTQIQEMRKGSGCLELNCPRSLPRSEPLGWVYTERLPVVANDAGSEKISDLRSSQDALELGAVRVRAKLPFREASFSPV